MNCLSPEDHASHRRRLASRRQELEEENNKLIASAQQEKDVPYLSCAGNVFAEDSFRDLMYTSALNAQTAAICALSMLRFAEARRLSQSALSDYELLDYDYLVRNDDAASRSKLASYTHCAQQLLDIIHSQELGNMEEVCAQEAFDVYAHTKADEHMRKAITHYKVLQEQANAFEDAINLFLQKGMAHRTYTPTRRQITAFVKPLSHASFYYTHALGMRFKLFADQKRRKYQQQIIQRHAVLKAEYELRIKSQKKSMHEYRQQFSNARDTQNTYKRLMYENASRSYDAAAHALAARDYATATNLSLSAISDFKLLCYDCWSQGMPFVTHHEQLQRAKRVLFCIQTHLAAKTAEEFACNQFAEGDYVNAISLTQDAISHYDKYHVETLQFDKDVAAERTKALDNSMSPQQVQDIYAHFREIKDTAEDSIRVTELMHQIQSEMWLHGATELRMLLKRNGLSIHATEPIHTFIKRGEPPSRGARVGPLDAVEA